MNKKDERLALAACGLGLLFVPFAVRASAAETIQLGAIALEPLRVGTNLLSNPGFEETGPTGIPAGWLWDRRNTDATCLTDASQAHRGRQSLRLINGTAFGAHVYGMLWRAQPVRLVEGKPYTMSAWVKSDTPGIVSLIGGGDWQFRVSARPTGGRWLRIARTFTPGPADCDFVLRISTESPTPGVWLDDVKLEEGTAATPDGPGASEGDRVLLEADEAESAVEGDGPFSVAFTLSSARAVAGTMAASLSSGQALRQPVNLPAGVCRVTVRGESALAGDAPRLLTLRLEEENKGPLVASVPVRFFSANDALARLAALKAALPLVRGDLAFLRSRGDDLSYPLVSATVLDNFIGYAEEDARRGQVRRALEQVGDLEAMAARLRGELKEALAGQRTLPAVPRWTGARRPVVKRSSFLASTRLPGGPTVERPVFFTGFGHFGQVIADMEKWPDYGANIIQIELGPSSLFPAEGRTNDAPVRELLRTLDRAQKAGVAVCLLISPHYFPDWALAKWPHLRKRREGFLQYCIHAPESRELLRRFIAVALGPIKDHPALHSICLSNEPVNEEEPCAPARQQWRAWLQKRHGDIATLNSRYGSDFTSFAAVPLPDPFGPHPAAVPWLDFIRFNQEMFADWHKMLADAVRAVAPGLPVHAKAMTWTMLDDGDLKCGVDAALFGGFSDINGNDSENWYNFDAGEFAQDWQQNAMAYDLQRSVRDAPVFNTENHLIVDRETRSVPAAHVRAALWQEAVHGQSATTIWVWERTFDLRSDFAGSIMHRPACAEAVGRVNLDLNRAALEITALQQAPPQAYILQSVSAGVLDDGAYSDCLDKLYTALSFMGVKVGFVTERQLESGAAPRASVLFVPAVVHLSDAAVKGMIPGFLIGNFPMENEYGHGRSIMMAFHPLPYKYGVTSARDLHRILGRYSYVLHPGVELRGASPDPVWGVEWRSAQTPGGTVVNLCNYRKEPMTVALFRAGQPVVARDVLTGAKVEGQLTLAPLEVRLVKLEPRNP